MCYRQPGLSLYQSDLSMVYPLFSFIYPRLVEWYATYSVPRMIYPDWIGVPIAAWIVYAYNGPLTRYVKLRVVHAPGMPGMFSPPPTSKETSSLWLRHASRHVRDARAVMHVGIANPRWRGKSTQHSRRMHNPQFYVSGKRSIQRV